MKLLLDQGLPLSAAELLRSTGLDTTHVSEVEMFDATDIEILNLARKEGRTVATLDADFHTLLALNAYRNPSVIRIRIERLRARAVTDLLLTVVAQCREDLLQGAAVTVDPRQIRVRQLPLVSNR